MIYLWIGLILLAVGTLIFALLRTKVRILVDYKEKVIHIVFRIGFIKIRTTWDALAKILKKERPKVPPRPVGEKESELDAIIRQLMDLFDDKMDWIKDEHRKLKNDLDILLRASEYDVVISDVRIRLNYGTGDAATTGMAYGVIWAVIGAVYGIGCEYFSISFPEVEIEPNYNEPVFDGEISGIIAVRLVHIINIILPLLGKNKNSDK